MNKQWIEKAAEHVSGAKGKISLQNSTAIVTHPDFPTFRTIFRDGRGITENNAVIFNDQAQIATEVTHEKTAPVPGTREPEKMHNYQQFLKSTNYEKLLKLVQTAFKKHAPK